MFIFIELYYSLSKISYFSVSEISRERVSGVFACIITVPMLCAVKRVEARPAMLSTVVSENSPFPVVTENSTGPS